MWSNNLKQPTTVITGGSKKSIFGGGSPGGGRVRGGGAAGAEGGGPRHTPMVSVNDASPPATHLSEVIPGRVQDTSSTAPTDTTSPAAAAAAAAAAKKKGGGELGGQQDTLDIMRIREWSPEEVGRWLALELAFDADVIQRFSEQGIDGDVLQTLTENDMRDDLGMSRLADRRRLGEAIRQLAQYDRYAQVRGVMDMVQQQHGDGSKGDASGGGVKVNIAGGAADAD